jgi:hypothetical protein
MLRPQCRVDCRWLLSRVGGEGVHVKLHTTFGGTHGIIYSSGASCMHCLPSQWIPRLFLLLLAACGAWAEERQCSLDSECGYREECRHAVVNKVVSAVKTCQCHHFVFADGHAPQCIACNWVSRAGEGGVGSPVWRLCLTVCSLFSLHAQRSVMAVIFMAIPLLAFTFAQTQYMVAFKEHMTDPPLRLVSCSRPHDPYHDHFAPVAGLTQSHLVLKGVCLPQTLSLRMDTHTHTLSLNGGVHQNSLRCVYRARRVLREPFRCAPSSSSSRFLQPHSPSYLLPAASSQYMVIIYTPIVIPLPVSKEA